MEISYINSEQTSWIAVHKKFYPSTAVKRHLINYERPDTYHKIKIAGREVEIPRFQQAYGKSYDYSGTTSESKEFVPIIERIKKRLAKEIESTDISELKESKNDYNMCLVNWYPDGAHYIGPHSDDEKQLVVGSSIASLSWGATRKFKLKAKYTSGLDLDIVLEDGDLVIMGGDCQKTHKHSVPKCKCDEERINFTFRVFK